MPESAKDVTAEIQYLANDRDLAVYIASVAGGEVQPHQGNYIMQPVVIHDGRSKPRACSLDREGFVFMESPSSITDFYDEDQIAKTYYPEIIELVKSTTGATQVEIFDHTRRATSDALRREKILREPANIIHNDYTAKSGVRRLKDHLDAHPDLDRSLLSRDFAIINVWRSIAGRIENFPLAMCDANSVAPEDLVSVTRQAKDRMGEIQLAVHRDSHNWTYFPDMEQDEVLLFKTFDSRNDGRAKFTIHTSFADPSAGKAARARESIEVRCFLFW